MSEHAELAAEIDAHLRTLRMADTQATAVAWMKRAHELLGRAASELERPRVFSVPGHFGAPTFMLTPPKPTVLVPPGRTNPPIWFRGQTVVYSENHHRAWTRADTRRLEREIALKAKT